MSFVEKLGLAEEIGHHGTPGAHGVARIRGTYFFLAGAAEVVFARIKSFPLIRVRDDAGKQSVGAIDFGMIRSVLTTKDQ